MTQQDKTKRMLALAEHWQQSDQGQQTFARQQNIKPKTFAYWIRKHKHHPHPSNGFLRIELSNTPPAQRLAVLEISLADGIVV